MPQPARIRPAIVRACAAAVGLCLIWGVLSGITEYHFAYACLLVALVLARCLTKAPAPRSAWLPALAALLAFAVGFLGDFVAVAIALWLHYDISAAVILGHVGELFANVARGHSAMDWVIFSLAAVAAAGLTARQQLSEGNRAPKARPSTTEGGVHAAEAAHH
ncbi:hypothetical protein [Catenulispora rubra]|uniref:hypothetical protein n=1 Tax=Catenulispora rubra TaxID=280293 RepID=UPI0018923197|nr:hypothetical protein [Catenulispora rubra]